MSGLLLWLGLVGCFLFISDAEHQARLQDLEADATGDTGEDSAGPEVSPFAGTYSGDMSVSCSGVVGPSVTCTGPLAVVVDAAGALDEGAGSCENSSETLGLDVSSLRGQIGVDDRITGTLETSGREVPWTGRVLISGDDRLLEGAFAGEVKTTNGVTLDCEGSFLLDD